MRHLLLALPLALGCSDPTPATLPDGATADDPACRAMGGPGTVRARRIGPSPGTCVLDCDPAVPWVTGGGLECNLRLDTVENCGVRDRRCTTGAPPRCYDHSNPDGSYVELTQRYTCTP